MFSKRENRLLGISLFYGEHTRKITEIRGSLLVIVPREYGFLLFLLKNRKLSENSVIVEGSANEEKKQRCRRLRYAGRPDRPRSVRLVSPAWNKCWRRCLPRVPERGIKSTERRIVEAELLTAVHQREDVDPRRGLRVLVSLARIRAFVVEPLLKVILRRRCSLSVFLSHCKVFLCNIFKWIDRRIYVGTVDVQRWDERMFIKRE